MGIRAKPRRPLRLVLAVAIAAAIGASTTFGAAVSLQGIATDDLYAVASSGTVPIPAAIVDDPFQTTSCNQALDGATDSLGNTWSNHWGGWRYQGCEEVRAQFRLPLAHASVDVGQSDDIVITTYLTRISTQNNRSGPGLSLFTDGFFHMYVIYERDQGRVTLGKWSPWANTPLTSVPISDRSTGEIAVVIDQPSLTVLVDGSQVLTYDLNNLTGPEQTQFLGQTRFGLEADSDNWSRFGWFKVEVLP